MFVIGIVMMITTLTMFYFALTSRGWSFGNPIVLNYDYARDGSRGIVPFGISTENISTGNMGDVVIVNKIIVEAGENIPNNGLVYTTGFNSDGNPIVFNYDEARDAPRGIVPFGIAIEDISNGNLGNIVLVNNELMVEAGEYIPYNGLVYISGVNTSGVPIVLISSRHTCNRIFRDMNMN